MQTPNKQGDDGWKSTLYEGQPLETYRRKYFQESGLDGDDVAQVQTNEHLSPCSLPCFLSMGMLPLRCWHLQPVACLIKLASLSWNASIMLTWVNQHCMSASSER